MVLIVAYFMSAALRVTFHRNLPVSDYQHFQDRWPALNIGSRKLRHGRRRHIGARDTSPTFAWPEDRVGQVQSCINVTQSAVKVYFQHLCQFLVIVCVIKYINWLCYVSTRLAFGFCCKAYIIVPVHMTSYCQCVVFVMLRQYIRISQLTQHRKIVQRNLFLNAR